MRIAYLDGLVEVEVVLPSRLVLMENFRNSVEEDLDNVVVGLDMRLVVGSPTAEADTVRVCLDRWTFGGMGSEVDFCERSCSENSCTYSRLLIFPK